MLFMGICKVSGQGLEHLPPVLKDIANLNETITSFVETSLDFRPQELKKPQQYYNCVEIFDADVTWPPRWFYAVPFADIGNDSVKRKTVMEAAGDARFQNGFFTFSRVKKTAGRDKGASTLSDFSGYIICNKKMEPVDTVKSGFNETLDLHDFRINERGERMIMANLDTVLDISGASGNPADTAVAASVALIEIMDSTNKIIFRWNSAAELGAGSLYYPEVNTRTYFKQNHMDWSHGTSALWDRDGNILYSLRFVGIGKISRLDGHVIWRFDRKNMPIVSGADTLEFYAQHDFEAISDTGDFSYYSLFSDGKRPDGPASAITFKVNKLSHDFKLISKRTPDVQMISGGAGNYEHYEDGISIMNYGQYPLKDSSERFHYFMEVRNRGERLLAQYQLPPLVFAYKVHRITNERPPRPVIVGTKKALRASGEMTDWTWYRLSGSNNTTVEKIGEGEDFSPREYGWYCVAGKYGIGWSVSKAYLFGKSLGDKTTKGKK